MGRYTFTRNRTERIKAHHDFGVMDKRCRRIGANIYTFEVDFELKPEALGGWTVDPGHYFVFQPNTTRNGQDYGPVQPWHLFVTTQERDAAIAKYLDGARKRAQKLAKECKLR